MKGKIVLITGANTGIGFETARGIAQTGATIVMACRDQQRGEDARATLIRETGNPSIDLMICDLADLDSVRRFADNFLRKYQRLDVLINNAGVSLSSWKPSRQGIEMQFAVNHLGHFLLTGLLLDALRAGSPSRIINVSSRHYARGRINFDSITRSTGWKYFIFKAYRQSKLANVLFTTELSRRLQGQGISAYSLHPGSINTDFGKKHTSPLHTFLWQVWCTLNFAMDSPEKGAQTSIYLATSPDVQGQSGQYFSHSKAHALSPMALDPVLAKKLWDFSEKLCGLPPLRVPSPFGESQLSGQGRSDRQGEE